eukprot:TRINITY_DN61277_c0_g1_i1.p2 TRINITY_DN61277_c0_g1~~TRINITY_DN61277_c0_g1_i1.p2  ORF type:complete len:122 (+),score=29.00 TRINITY_DN61277_c0_g1_i1:458-823(+)
MTVRDKDSLEGILERYRQNDPQTVFVILSENGMDLGGALQERALHKSLSSMVLIVGDDVGFSPEQLGLCQQFGAVEASIGPTSLLASHCIVIAHNVIDKLVGAVVQNSQIWQADFGAEGEQ